LAALFVLVQPAAAQSQDRNNPTPLTTATVSGPINASTAGRNYYYSFFATPGIVSVTLTVEGGAGVLTDNKVTIELSDQSARNLTTGTAHAERGQAEQIVQRANVLRRQRLTLRIGLATDQAGAATYTVTVGGPAEFGPPTTSSDPDPGSGPAAPSAFRITGLSWLTGCWQSTASSRPTVITERWSPLAGNMMMGVGQTVNGTTTTEFEFTRIVQDGPNVFYIAKPSQNPGETSFKLIKLVGQEATFENPQHDFPQRVIYRRTGDNLTGRIEGNNNGRMMGIDFPMVRVRCE
jgi:hypothetical protein